MQIKGIIPLGPSLRLLISELTESRAAKYETLSQSRAVGLPALQTHQQATACVATIILFACVCCTAAPVCESLHPTHCHLELQQFTGSVYKMTALALNIDYSIGVVQFATPAFIS